MRHITIVLASATASLALLLVVLFAIRARTRDAVTFYKMGTPSCIKFDRTYGIVSDDVELSRRCEFKETIDLRLAKHDDIRPQVALMCEAYPCFVIRRGSEIVKVGSGATTIEGFKTWLGGNTI